MADYAFNISKDRIAEFFNRVDTEDPSTARIVLVPLSASGTAEQGQDYDNLKTLLEDVNFTEQSTGGWERKELAAADLAALAPDDTNDRMDTEIPEVTWTAPTEGNDTTGVLVCYDPKTAEGTDEEIVPITHHDMAVTADGNDVTINAGDIVRTS